MFVYCRNNSVSRKDVAGTMSFDCADDTNDLSNNDINDWSGGGWEGFRQSLHHAARGLNMAMGNKNPMYTEYHHIFSNKNKTYSPQYQEILDRYNMSLDSQENIVELGGHRGRHTNVYHDFMLNALIGADQIAQGNLDEFYIGFMIIVDFLLTHQGLPYAK